MTAFNDIERMVIELADALSETPANVSDDLYARLRNQFSEEQIMQLGGQIAFENYRARWNRLLTSRATICTRHKQSNRDREIEFQHKYRSNPCWSAAALL
jgi:hypothetical protein